MTNTPAPSPVWVFPDEIEHMKEEKNDHQIPYIPRSELDAANAKLAQVEAERDEKQKTIDNQYSIMREMARKYGFTEGHIVQFIEDTVNGAISERDAARAEIAALREALAKTNENISDSAQVYDWLNDMYRRQDAGDRSTEPRDIFESLLEDLSDRSKEYLSQTKTEPNDE